MGLDPFGKISSSGVNILDNVSWSPTLVVRESTRPRSSSTL